MERYQFPIPLASNHSQKSSWGRPQQGSVATASAGKDQLNEASLRAPVLLKKLGIDTTKESWNRGNWGRIGSQARLPSRCQLRRHRELLLSLKSRGRGSQDSGGLVYPLIYQKLRSASIGFGHPPDITKEANRLPAPGACANLNQDHYN